MNECGQGGANEQNGAGNQPDGPFDVPAVGRNDVDAGSHGDGSRSMMLGETKECSDVL
jgi:hypothetical protein